MLPDRFPAQGSIREWDDRHSAAIEQGYAYVMYTNNLL